MRRKDREITDFTEIIEIIRTQGLCRIAIKDEPFPYIVPLNYGAVIDGDNITLYFHSAREGRKLELLRKDPRVAFEIDCNQELVYDNEKGSCSMLYQCVSGTGVIQFLEEEEKMAALKLILKQHGRGEEFQINQGLFDRTICYKLTVNEVTGKRH